MSVGLVYNMEITNTVWIQLWIFHVVGPIEHEHKRLMLTEQVNFNHYLLLAQILIVKQVILHELLMLKKIIFIMYFIRKRYF